MLNLMQRGRHQLQDTKSIFCWDQENPQMTTNVIFPTSSLLESRAFLVLVYLTSIVMMRPKKKKKISRTSTGFSWCKNMHQDWQLCMNESNLVFGDERLVCLRMNGFVRVSRSVWANLVCLCQLHVQVFLVRRWESLLQFLVVDQYKQEEKQKRDFRSDSKEKKKRKEVVEQLHWHSRQRLPNVSPAVFGEKRDRQLIPWILFQSLREIEKSPLQLQDLDSQSKGILRLIWNLDLRLIMKRVLKEKSKVHNRDRLYWISPYINCKRFNYWTGKTRQC